MCGSNLRTRSFVQFFKRISKPDIFGVKVNKVVLVSGTVTPNKFSASHHEHSCFGNNACDFKARCSTCVPMPTGESCNHTNPHLPLLEISSSSFYDDAQGLYVICCLCCLLPSRRGKTLLVVRTRALKGMCAILGYSSIPGHGNWQIETAVWNLAGLLHCDLEPTGSDLGSFLMIYEEILSWIFEIGFQKNRVGNPT